MFEQLVNDTAARLNLPVAKIEALLRGLLALMTRTDRGGVEGFVDRFRGAGLGDLITSWFGGKAGAALPAAQLESALGTETLDALAGASGLTRTSASSALGLLLPAVMSRLTPSGTLPSTKLLIAQVSSYLSAPGSMPGAPVERTRWPKWVPWAMAAAAVLLIAWLALRLSPGTIEPQLTLNNREGKVTYTGLVRDDATRDAIVSALRTAFGEANLSGDIRVDPNVKRASWLPRLGELFASLKVPGLDFSLTGDAINLGGWISAADRQSITARLQGLFGTQTAVGALGDAAAEAIRAANDKAMSALGAIGTSGVSADSLVQAMNLSIVNFASGSAEIPAESMGVLRKSAEAMKRAPAGTAIEVGGHTDDTGDPDGNFTLSQRRADAVRNALVAEGVPEGILTARGYGDSRPRSTNDTEYGRFQNRRIEYNLVR